MVHILWSLWWKRAYMQFIRQIFYIIDSLTFFTQGLVTLSLGEYNEKNT